MFTDTHIHTCPCAHTYIHTLCIPFPLFKSQVPYNHLKWPCFPLFLRAKLSEFITHFSIFAAAMPAHIPGIFSVQEMHVLMKCHCSLILFSVSGKPSFPSFTQPGSFWGLMKRNDAILRENLSAYSLCV